MSTTFPTTLQDLDATRGTTGQPLSSPNHITHHTNEDDTIEALQAKVGVDNSAVTTTLDYKLKSTSSLSPGHKHNTSDLVDNTGLGILAGVILPYGGSAAPTGYFPCNGATVSRTTYSTLFTVIGTNFGIGDGSTTFNLPNLAGRVIVGYSSTATGKIYKFSSRATNTITVTVDAPDVLANTAFSELQTGQAVTYSTNGTVITGLTNNTTYYLVRVTYNQFQLSTSAALANQVATGAIGAISLTSDGTGVQTFTTTYNVRPLGEKGGTETASAVQLHTHSVTGQQTAGGGSGSSSGTGSSLVITNTGVDAPSNLPLYQVVNYIIKY